MNKKFSLLILILVVLTVSGWSIIHKVINGDTLWALAEKYYRNPWLWQKIYQANKEIIKDPHWIFPEQEFVIPEITEVKSSAPEETTLTEEPTQITETQEEIPEETIEVKKEIPELEPKYHSRSFAAPIDYKFDGRIISAEKDQVFILQGDLVYLDIGLKDEVKKDTKCYVLRRKGKIIDSKTKKVVGYRIAKIGILKLTEEINEKSSTAIVYRSYDPILKGDYIKIIK